jgi:hypothetical protein
MATAKRIKVRDVRRLGELQCTQREAAGFLGVRLHTFKRLLKDDEAVRDAWERGQQMGLVSLRRKQMRLASVNATMAKWLGIQYLNQRDVIHQELTGKDGGPIDIDLTALSPGERDELRKLLTRASQPGSGST